MPSAKTHDRVTLLLAPPAFAATWAVTQSPVIATAVTAGWLFGGLMFGPDLDTQSKAYQRWGPLRVLWYPYKVIFRHRSRLSHGLLLGTAVRVLYFTAALTLFIAAVLYGHNVWLLHQSTTLRESLREATLHVWEWLRAVDRTLLIAFLLGSWGGAASHTLTDWAVTVWRETIKML
ncbi:MAG: metal-binding protein [Abditibacteriales bacterium]|nr:metal-binding protein [Abditibacteriales bacterium]MDW8366744.1 metal-binding protein [Abditibacteriales bacterium]